MANPFVHVELTTTDTGKAKSFYGALFDWKLDDVEMAPGLTYTMIGVGEGTGGGMMKTPAPGVPTAWLPYVLVDDVVAATAKGKSLGAMVCKDVTGDGSGLLLHHHRSDRRGDRALARKGEMTRGRGHSSTGAAPLCLKASPPRLATLSADVMM